MGAGTYCCRPPDLVLKAFYYNNMSMPFSFGSAPATSWFRHIARLPPQGFCRRGERCVMAYGRAQVGAQNHARHCGWLKAMPGCGVQNSHSPLIILVAMGISLLLSACSSGSLVDSLPSSVTESAAAPKRAAVAPDFPPVHDTPAPRAAGTLSAAEQKKLESELVAARESQKTGTIPPPPAAAPAKPAAQAVKKKPTSAAEPREAAAGNSKTP